MIQEAFKNIFAWFSNYLYLKDNKIFFIILEQFQKISNIQHGIQFATQFFLFFCEQFADLFSLYPIRMTNWFCSTISIDIF